MRKAPPAERLSLHAEALRHLKGAAEALTAIAADRPHKADTVEGLQVDLADIRDSVERYLR